MKKFLTFIPLLYALTFAFYTSPVHATSPTPSPCSLDPATFSTNPADKKKYDDYVNKYGDCPAGLTDIENVFGNLVSAIMVLGFIAMLVVIVMAGFKYLTSGGEPKALQAAHHTLAWAILGIFLMAVAWVLLQLIQAFTGIPVTVFNIKILCRDPNDITKLFCK